MFSRIHSKLGTAGLVVAIVALVAALGGGAYAANGGLDKQQKKQVRNIAKNLDKKASLSKRQKSQVRNIAKGSKGEKGDPGAPGANGLPGPAGPVGPQGAPGSAGAKGANGDSVVVDETALGCPEGGITVEVEGSGEENEICNGENGEEGPAGPKGDPGDPWAVGGVLPENATETGVYAYSGPAGTYGFPAIRVPISFTIPLAAGPEGVFVPSGGPNPDPTNCPGSFEEPEAASGFLCVYELSTEGIEGEPLLLPPNPSGGFLGALEVEAGEAPGMAGSWAVTG